MIFAAGHGTRMGQLTRARPKPLLTLAGKTLLDRALALAEAEGIGRLVVNTHYRADQINAALAGRNVAISHEAPSILDTGGGLRNASSHLGSSPVYTLNPDAVFLGPNPLSFLRGEWRKRDCSALLLLVPLERAEMRAGGGDFSMTETGRLARRGPMVHTGAQIIETEGLAEIDATVFSLNTYWDRLATAGRLHGVVYPGRWCDVGTPEALAHAERLLSEARP